MKKIIAIMLALLLTGCAAQPVVTQPQTEGTGETQTQPAATEKTQVDVQALYASLEGVGMPEMLELDETMRLNLYGIRSDAVVQAKVMVCAEGLRADEIWLLEAVDEAAAQELKGLADNRVAQKDAESVTYSPEQNVIVRKSHVAVYGNFVVFICSPDVEAMTAIVEDTLG